MKLLRLKISNLFIRLWNFLLIEQAALLNYADLVFVATWKPVNPRFWWKRAVWTIGVATSFRDGCIRPRGPRRTGAPEGPIVSKVALFAIALGPQTTPGGPNWDGWAPNTSKERIWMQEDSYVIRIPRKFTVMAPHRLERGPRGPRWVSRVHWHPLQPPGYVPGVNNLFRWSFVRLHYIDIACVMMM